MGEKEISIKDSLITLKNNLVTATCLLGRRYSGSFKRRNWNRYIPQRGRWTCLQKLQTGGNLSILLLIKIK